jgi:NDP-sugar pyrophosphorylase family protein
MSVEACGEESLADSVRRLSSDSAFLKHVAALSTDGGVEFALGSLALRGLYKSEIETLESMGSTARDWSLVRVAEGFNARRVRDCEFHGRVVLGVFNKYVTLADGVEVIAGLSRSTLADCVVGHNSLIRNVGLLANTVIGSEALVIDCGRITCRPCAAFGNGRRLAIALEGGGRELDVFAEIDVELAAAVTRPGSRRGEVPDYRRAVAEYTNRATADRGFIGPGASVRGVHRIEDAYIGPASNVDGAHLILRSTLLSAEHVPVLVESGSIVTDSLLQWGSSVSSMSIVESSVLIEQSRVHRQGKVQNSLIGANAEVAAGEVSSSLLGPLVNAPHESLIIATHWPGGRGNVGYGANVGSNHTSRAPDQEFRAGEGMFIGLGANIKFPCDFTAAPYSVIACGVDVPPQRVAFPFSLIVPGSGVDAPPGNRIRPAWMLAENMYALKRNEAKFRARFRARRSTPDFRVIRSETVALMEAALQSLQSSVEPRQWYTQREIPGLGANVLAEDDRIRAIEAYRFHIHHWRHLEILQRLLSRQAASDRDPDCEVLAELKRTAFAIAENCRDSREKDHLRGMRIIDDYEEVHPATSRDRVVQAAFEEAESIRVECDRILAELALPSAIAAAAPAL